MPHPLEQKLARLRRRARQYVLAKVIARGLTLVLEVGLALAALDALFHYHDRGLRAISSLVLLSTAAVAAQRIWRTVRDSRYSSVQIAQKLEQMYPALRGAWPAPWNSFTSRPTISWLAPCNCAAKSFATPRGPWINSTFPRHSISDRRGVRSTVLARSRD